jgi:hypothetical protein
MLSNSEVSEGSGSMLVIATGDRTQWAAGLREDEDSGEEEEEHVLTPLQRRLNRLSLDIGKVGIVASAAIFIVLMFWWFIDEIWGQPWKWEKLPHLIRVFVMTLTIVVVAVPEGLPMAVSVRFYSGLFFFPAVFSRFFVCSTQRSHYHTQLVTCSTIAIWSGPTSQWRLWHLPRFFAWIKQALSLKTDHMSIVASWPVSNLTPVMTALFANSLQVLPTSSTMPSL